MFVIRVVKFTYSPPDVVVGYRQTKVEEKVRKFLRSTDFGKLNVKCSTFTKTDDPPKRSNACHVVLHFKNLGTNKFEHVLKVNCERC